MTRKFWYLIRLAASLFFGCALLSVSAHAQETRASAAQPAPSADSAAAKAMAEHTGIWKAAVPPVPMKGMFGNADPIGLVAGKLIPADCSINWTDPDTHKLYCFSSATSLVYFLDAPQTYLTEAQKSWRALGNRAGKPR